ncbi:hypothetical protein ACWC5C_40480, partial [Streptomyces sp. NPDC001700]
GGVVAMVGVAEMAALEARLGPRVRRTEPGDGRGAARAAGKLPLGGSPARRASLGRAVASRSGHIPSVRPYPTGRRPA